ELVEKTWEQLVQDQRSARKESVYQPALWNTAPGRRIGRQDVALHDRDGPIAFRQDPGGQESANARAENYCPLTYDRHRPHLILSRFGWQAFSLVEPVFPGSRAAAPQSNNDHWPGAHRCLRPRLRGRGGLLPRRARVHGVVAAVRD